jgi:exosome complex component RRP42
MEISKIMKKKIEELISKGKRIDERDLKEYRNLEIRTKISAKAEGSAWVKLGDTEVIAGVKMDAIEPFRDSPDEGVLAVAAELSPLSSDRFESGPPGIQAIELARIIDRGIRNSEFIDMKKLCIKEKEKVWSVSLDIYPINDSGSLIDAAFIASVVALKEAFIPEYKDDEVQYGELSNKKLPLREMPINTTVYKIDNKFVLDPLTEEEDAANTRLSFTITYPSEVINAMQKTGQELTEEEILEMESIALKEGKKLHAKVLSLIK